MNQQSAYMKISVVVVWRDVKASAYPISWETFALP